MDRICGGEKDKKSFPLSVQGWTGLVDAKATPKALTTDEWGHILSAFPA